MSQAAYLRRVSRLPLEILLWIGVVLSGCATMILENTWTKELGSVCSSSSATTFLALCSSLAGLMVGSALSPWLGRRVIPIAAFAASHLLLAAFGLVFPRLIQSAGDVSWQISGVVSHFSTNTLRWGIMAVLLFVPGIL